MPTRRGALLLGLIAAACGCELVSHAFDYRVTPTPEPEGLLCEACPAGGADRRLPPCPISSAAPDLDRTFVFAARRSRLGKPADEASPVFDLGIDLDCSDRADGGVPLLCAPRTTQGWTTLPHGIDDALLARVLAPAYDALPQGRGIDLDALFSAALERGAYGVLVEVRGWNGTPDDGAVEVSIRTSPGLVSGGTPRWAGDDVWAPYAEVDPDGVARFALDRVQGYVAGGTLVLDARAEGARLFRFGPSGASFTLLAHDLSFTGSLTTAGLANFVASGVLDQSSAAGAAHTLRASFGSCAGGALGKFFEQAEQSVPLAADMAVAPSADPSSFCDGISFGWALDAEPALLAMTPAPGGTGGGASSGGHGGCD